MTRRAVLSTSCTEKYTCTELYTCTVCATFKKRSECHVATTLARRQQLDII